MSNSSVGHASDPKRDLLRHALATLAYRGGKPIRNAPENFAAFNAEGGVRAPEKILAHIGDLMDWALTIAIGKREWRDSQPLTWESEVERLFATIKNFDDHLASSEPLHASPDKLLQGPIADALTHVGQIAMLRRMAGKPLQGESYYEADITVGRVSADQAKPKREF
jgi:hypothetical protein